MKCQQKIENVSHAPSLYLFISAEASAKRGAENAEKMAKDEDLTHTIIAAAIEVHRTLGPGLLEEEENLSQGEVLPF